MTRAHALRLVLAIAAAALVTAFACDEPASRAQPDRPVSSTETAPETPPSHAESAEEAARWATLRAHMVDQQIAARDVDDARVLEAMRRVPRHRFVPEPYQSASYEDRPLQIGHEQTISQPYIVGIMSQLIEVEPGQKVLEIGTGSGYQAAVLAEMGCEVYSIEIVEPLGRRARALLERLGYDRARVRIGDGYRGWPAHAPFDAVLLTAAPPSIPEPLMEQLRVGGTLVAPVGTSYQELVVVKRTATGFTRRTAFPVRFVPMTGEARGD